MHEKGLVRGQPKKVGAQNLLGKTATVVSSCRPDGQVRVGGELWAARCPNGADRGATVEVVGRDLELVGDYVARLGDDLLARRMERGTADREAPAPVRVEPVGRDARVAVCGLLIVPEAARLLRADQELGDQGDRALSADAAY